MAAAPPPAPRKPILYNAAIVVCILLAVFGAVAAALGLGGSTVFEVEITDKFKLKTTAVGLAIMSAGLLGAIYLLTRAPAGVQVFAGGAPETWVQRARKAAPLVTAVSVLALLTATVIVVVDH